MKSFNLIIISSLLVLSFGLVPASGKQWTVEQRQAELMRTINKAQKDKQLTLKEAKKLRGDLADVSRKKSKLILEKGKISKEEMTEIEGDLNDVSLRINKMMLEKRVDSGK